VTLEAAPAIERTAVPVTDGFWVEVAVIVTDPEDGAVPGAVYKPLEEMVPTLADQFTAVLKLPPGKICAPHEDVPPGLRAAGPQ
jgi:hypothetical protein